MITAHGVCVGHLSCGDRQDHLRPARHAKPWRLNVAVASGGSGSLRTPLPLTMADRGKAPLISLMSQPDNQPARYRSFEPLPDLARPVSTGGLQFPVLVQRRLAFIQLGGVVR